MASKSSPAGAEKVDIEELLDVVDKTMERLKVLYEQYFLGMQKQPPTQIHTDVERRLRDLQQISIRNTGLRYRFATAQQKFGSYNSYWRRTLRQIENGTYIRQLAKVGRQAVMTGAEIPEEILAAMPLRMREQVKRDRETALAVQRRRSGEPADDVNQEDAAVIGESVDLRSALPKNTSHKLEDDGDFDIDAFFASVTNEDAPMGATQPLPRMAAPSKPGLDTTQVVPVVPMPSGRPPPVPRAASQGGAPPPVPPGAIRSPGAPAPDRPGMDRTQLMPALRPTPTPGTGRDATLPLVVAPSPRPTSGVPSLTGRGAAGPSQAGARPAPKSEGMDATRVVPVVPMPGAAPRPPPPQRPVQPSAPATPPSSMPSQQTRPNPIAPGAATGRQAIPVQTLGGRAPEKPEPPQRPPVGMNDADVNALYAKYVKAKEMVGEQAGPGAYGKLLKTINAQAPKIMEQYKAKGVEFSIVVKDNQVIIKAKPKT